MGFYGKIYEQMGDVFNRAKFINAHPNTFTFNAETDDVVIDAESHGDRLPIKAGNNWIAFEPGLDDKGNPACVIYHGAPQRDAQGGGRVAAKSVIGQITRTPGISDFLALTDADSTLLTDEEKQALLDMQDNLLYFGDKIGIYSPVRDEAGHVIRFEYKEWQLGSIPRLADILTAEGRIVNLEEIVGIEGYPEEANSLADRTQLLEDDFAEVREIAADAAELAAAADASATAAQESATEAERSAERAANAAEEASTNLTEYQEETDAQLEVVDNKYTSLIGAVGVSDAVPVANKLGYGSIYLWALYADSELDVLNGIIGDEDDAIRNGTANTLVQQIHNNDADIEQLQKDLTQEIAGRTADVNAEEQARITAINELKQYTDTQLESLATSAANSLNSQVSTLQAADTALGGRIDTEANTRSNADAALGSRINTEASARETADQAINTRIDGIDTSITGEGGIHARLTAVEQKASTNSEKLVGDETVAGSVASKIKTAVDAEANVRSAKDNELADEIAALADLITDLQGLVEAQQSTITELQEKVVELENIINPPENPDPGTGDEGGGEEPPATE